MIILAVILFNFENEVFVILWESASRQVGGVSFSIIFKFTYLEKSY